MTAKVHGDKEKGQRSLSLFLGFFRFFEECVDFFKIMVYNTIITN